MSVNWPAVNSDIAVGVTSIGMAPCFDAYGAKGDGATDDTIAMQAAIDANAGRAICGVPGRTYLISAPLYLPTNTKCFGRGATLIIPVTPTTVITGMMIVGLAGVPASDELAATDVEIAEWRFISPTGNKGQSMITFQPGCARVNIHNNHFESTFFRPFITAVFMNKKRLREIKIDNNTFRALGRFVFVRGSEGQTGTNYYYDIHGPTDLVETSPSTIAPPVAGMTYFIVPNTPPDGETISPRDRMLPPYNWRWGVVQQFTAQPFRSYGIRGPADGGDDMSFNGVDRVTFASHIAPLPTDSNAFTRFFVWNPAIDPANDLNGLQITNNRGGYTTAGTIALFCQVGFANLGRIPKNDGIRNIVIDNNTFEFTYQPNGNIANLIISDVEDLMITNYALWSENFTNAVWTRTGLGTPVSGSWGPRYDTSHKAASQLPESATTGQHKITQSFSSLSQVGSWTASIFLQAGTRSTTRLTWATTTGVGGYVDVDLVLGTITGTGAISGGTLNFYGVIPYGDGWFRVYLDCNLTTTSAIFTLALTNGTGVTSYTGVTTNYLNAFGLQIEDQPPAGNIYWLRNVTPTQYKPTLDQAISEVGSAVIAIDGTVNFQCTNNIISAAIGQGIHVEDSAAYGIISNNVISECAFGINVMNCYNITVSNNTISRFHKQAITVRGRDPAPRKLVFSQWVEFTGSISGTTLTVTAISDPLGNLLPNSNGNYKTLDCPAHGNYPGEVKPGTRILDQLTGTPGSTGTYQVSRSQTVTFPTPSGITKMSAAFGIQTENVVVTGNTIDAAGFPGVQTAYWIESSYDPFYITIDNPPTRGLVSDPLPAPVEYYYNGTATSPIVTVQQPTILSVSSPTLSAGSGTNLIRSMIPSGNFLYIVSAVVSGSTYLNIIDFSDPTAPTEISETLIGTANSTGQIQLAGSYLYVSMADNTHSVKIVDVTDPWTPVVAATIATGTGSGTCALVVAGNLLFVGTNTLGMFRIYNLSVLPAVPPLISTTSLTNVVQINQIVVRGKYAYLTEANNTDTNLGLQIIDISNPAAPTLAGTYDASLGATGDFDCRGLAVSGRYAFTAVIEVGGNNTVTLHVVDISNPAAPTIALYGSTPVVFPLAQAPQNVGNPLVMSGDTIYVPGFGGLQGGNGLYRYSVTNPLTPYLFEGLNIGGNGTAVVISGNLLFAANSGTSNNLNIIHTIGLAEESAVFGSLRSERARLDNLDVDRDVRINGSINVGNNGLASKGMIAGSSTATRLYTFATLPAGRIGMRAMISDALTPTFLTAVTGGGAVRSPVFWDDGSSSWKVG